MTRRRVRKVRRRRRWPWLLAVLAVVLLALGIAEAYRLRAVASRLTGAERVLRDSAAVLGPDPGSWTDARVANASGLQAEGLAEARAGRQELEADPVLDVLGVVPFSSDQVGAVRDLAAAAEAGAGALGDQVQVSRAYLSGRAGAAPSGHRLLDLINATTGPLDHAQQVLQDPVERLRRDQGHALLPQLSDRVSAALHTLEPRYQQAAAVAAVGRYLPAALGAEGKRTYLLLLPNPAELRPGGGFAGAVGSISFSDGSPGVPDIHDEDDLDRRASGDFPPPANIAHYMKFPYGRIDLGDNLDPQFPRQAPVSEALYTSATGVQVDGTVSIDPYAISAMLGLTGPVEVPGYGRFDSGNFFPRLNQIVNAEHGPGSGKTALAPISRAVLQRVLALPLNAYPRLVETLQEQGRQRHIQFALHDAAAARASAAAGYDGALVPARDDYVLLTEANIGGTKGDYFLHRSMSLRVEVTPGGISRHELVMHYDMPLPVNDVDRALNPQAGSYQDYLRLYVPMEATVRAVTYRQDNGAPVSALDAVSLDLGRRVVGSFFVLPRGHQAELRVVYETPLRDSNRAQLYIQKQPGRPGYPMEVEVSYPGRVFDQTLIADRDHALDFAW